MEDMKDIGTLHIGDLPRFRMTEITVFNNEDLPRFCLVFYEK